MGWSGASRSTPINDKTDRKKPAAWRKGNRKTRRSVNAVSIAQSENGFGAPGRPDGDGRHASVASAERYSVTSPRWTKACSYADQFPTRYFVLYCGWTFDIMSRSCTRSGHRGQRAYSCLVAAEGLCTNAVQRRRFPAEYRLRILKQADACKKPGEVGALLRREGLYSSLLANWRRQREAGRSSAFARWRSSVDNPARWPVSRSAWRTHFRNVSGVQPSVLAIAAIAAHGDGCSAMCSWNSLTARARTSGEHRLGRAMGVSSQGIGPPGNPVRFSLLPCPASRREPGPHGVV